MKFRQSIYSLLIAPFFLSGTKSTFKPHNMKHKFFPGSVIIFTFSYMLLAFVPKPFAYILSSFDPAKGQVKGKLEQSTAIFQKPKGKATASSSSLYNISGAKSGVRLKINETIFQSLSDKTTGTMNPADYIYLYKLSVDKTNRTFTINTDGTTNAMLVSIVFTPLDPPLTYKVAPASGLVPGEYAFIDRSTTTADGNMIVWTFGVD